MDVTNFTWVYGRGGWTRFESAGGLDGVLYVRYAPDSQGRWRPAELYLDGRGQEITSHHLRVPLSLLNLLAARAPEVLAEMSRKPIRSVAASLNRAFITKPKTSPPPFDEHARLSAPKEGLTDTFLRDVAAAYTAAVHRGERPNLALAEQSGAPPRTVERWVYLARKRGSLPPGRPARLSSTTTPLPADGPLS